MRKGQAGQDSRCDAGAVPAAVVPGGEVLAVSLGQAGPPLPGRLHGLHGRPRTLQHPPTGALLRHLHWIHCKARETTETVSTRDEYIKVRGILEGKVSDIIEGSTVG